MAVCIVSGDSVLELDGVRDSELIAEDLFVFALRESGVALLNFALQALFRSKERACAVYIDGTTFEYDAAALVRSEKELLVQRFAGANDDLRVFLVIRVLCPAV